MACSWYLGLGLPAIIIGFCMCPAGILVIAGVHSIGGGIALMCVGFVLFLTGIFTCTHHFVLKAKAEQAKTAEALLSDEEKTPGEQTGYLPPSAVNSDQEPSTVLAGQDEMGQVA